MADTPNEKDQSQKGGAKDQSQKGGNIQYESDSSGAGKSKGNDPVTEEQGASVIVVSADKTGYKYDHPTPK
ncbi:hypothetical protein FOIG_16490 [Fusarium odoratissimum NRRL 54006]|uniref:Uncharacterized protein n=2 Tax=Fusarium oxysporum species complex TaxID=171631 RepID=X0JZG9_FUSO5|nr:uncharacterized protein FOIG_16490 [Fusarium odoratissimum NRRL 54006]EXL90249.1 hypothetical protein FOIG_16490 [Fusarium odoratissimum NRRL 54006]TXB96630.1 hypothetical protein FocTR4_00012181 [Fusarium oxysporum f. sp. cubense]